MIGVMISVPGRATELRLRQRITPLPPSGCPPLALVDPDWLGIPADPPHAGIRRFLTDLSLPVREHAPSITFSKAAFVDLGPVRAGRDGCEVEIGWRSASLAPLFPVFAGRLTVMKSELRLEGFYAPPGGDLGLVLDHAFLGIGARGTARWFLGQVARALEDQDENSEI